MEYRFTSLPPDPFMCSSDEKQSRSPLATGSYGEGFARELGLAGGWYSKTANLTAYYADKDLAAAVNPDAYAPELTLGTVRYESVWWDPSGIALAPTLKSGVMAGIAAAQAASKPVDPDKLYETLLQWLDKRGN